MLTRLTIKQKILIGVCLSVLISALSVGGMNLTLLSGIMEKQLLEQQLPTQLQSIRKDVEKDLDTMTHAARQLANDPQISLWFEAGRPPEQEPLMLEKLRRLRQQYELMDASFVDRQSAAYYNQNGFLRLLTPQQDGWFYAYNQSPDEYMLSIFREPTGEVKLFVNFKLLDGRVASGLSKSLDSMIAQLASKRLEQSGFVFMADGKGMIKLHPETALIDQQTLSQRFGPAAGELLHQQPFALSRALVKGEPMIIASSYIPALDWYLIAQVPEAEVYAPLHQAQYYTLILVVGTLLVMGICALWLAGSISRPIQQLAVLFENLGSGHGDLTHRLDASRNDELGRVAQGFNRFIGKIHGSLQQVAENSGQLALTAGEVASRAENSYHNSQTQKDSTIQVATAINEMGATVGEIATNAAHAADVTKAANTESDKGLQVVATTRQAVASLADEIAVAGSVIGTLVEHTQSIGSILEVIRGISEQTNLLALNAAIEAARAGEQGRGFAVVADEVRTLARRSAEATEEIQQTINRLQGESDRAVTAMQSGQDRAHQVVSEAQAAEQALGRIARHIEQLNDMNIQIATATEEQSSVVGEINRNVDEINNLTLASAAIAEELTTTSRTLRELSHQLDTLLGQFQL